MITVRLVWVIAVSCCMCVGCSPGPHRSNLQTFTVKVVLEEVKADGRTAVIQHEAISNYMAAMTMPFKTKDPAQLLGLQPGDEISFRLLVNDEDSWIDQISRTGRKAPRVRAPTSASASTEQPGS